MTLTGKEIRVLLGGITLYLHIPFTKIQKRRLSLSEENELERLDGEFFEEAEQKAGWLDSDPWMTKVSKRLKILVCKEFTQEELRLLTEILLACIQEARNDTGLNVYFGGDDYGIVLDDFKRLLTRLKNLS